MGRIEILPPELVNQIAAGEVVERPSSVIKELVENAIDAGATRLEITASDGGRQLRVADNGVGMDRDDLEVAFHNHATSKVKNIDDLFAISTLGFRGEALASIAAIAKVTCISRTADSQTGLKALVQPNGQVSLQETGCAVGTIFEIRDLFYNVPARLKFLKRPQTELSHIQEMVQMLALSHPEIAFQLTVENSQAVKTSGSGNLEKAISEVFTLSESETLVPFQMEDPEFGYRVWGLTSTPNVTRGSRKWTMTFVNGRALRCSILGKAIESAYTSMIVPGKFSVTILFLEVPPEEVDVNVHPTKKEVKYQKANTLFSFVRRAIEMSLSSFPAQRSSLVEPPAVSQNNSYSEPRSASTPGYSFPPATPNKSYASLPMASHRTTSEIPKATEPAYNQAAFQLYSPPQKNEGEILDTPDANISAFHVIGQLSKTYILVENAEGLLVVDQHIAAERYLFEVFSRQAEKAEPVSQQLLLPITLPISVHQADSLEENRAAFEAIGFQYQLENQSVSFTWVPSLYSEKVLHTSLEALLTHLEETGEVKLSFDDVIATAACHSAVRAGDILNQAQMERIIGQWFQCQRPWTCPHGRPVSHQMTHRDLMNFFERPSLPINSRP